MNVSKQLEINNPNFDNQGNSNILNSKNQIISPIDGNKDVLISNLNNKISDLENKLKSMENYMKIKVLSLSPKNQIPRNNNFNNLNNKDIITRTFSNENKNSKNIIDNVNKTNSIDDNENSYSNNWKKTKFNSIDVYKNDNINSFKGNNKSLNCQKNNFIDLKKENKMQLEDLSIRNSKSILRKDFSFNNSILYSAKNIEKSKNMCNNIHLNNLKDDMVRNTKDNSYFSEKEKNNKKINSIYKPIIPKNSNKNPSKNKISKTTFDNNNNLNRNENILNNGVEKNLIGNNTFNPNNLNSYNLSKSKLSNISFDSVPNKENSLSNKKDSTISDDKKDKIFHSQNNLNKLTGFKKKSFLFEEIQSEDKKDELINHKFKINNSLFKNSSFNVDSFNIENKNDFIKKNSYKVNKKNLINNEINEEDDEYNNQIYLNSDMTNNLDYIKNRTKLILERYNKSVLKLKENIENKFKI